MTRSERFAHEQKLATEEDPAYMSAQCAWKSGRVAKAMRFTLRATIYTQPSCRRWLPWAVKLWAN